MVVLRQPLKRYSPSSGRACPFVEGTNIVRRELGLSEARVRAAGPRLYFADPGALR
jgi:hypothetical protein